MAPLKAITYVIKESLVTLFLIVFGGWWFLVVTMFLIVFGAFLSSSVDGVFFAKHFDMSGFTARIDEKDHSVSRQFLSEISGLFSLASKYISKIFHM